MKNLKNIKLFEQFKIFENNETPSAESIMLVIEKEFEEFNLDDEYDSDREFEWVESNLTHNLRIICYRIILKHFDEKNAELFDTTVGLYSGNNKGYVIISNEDDTEQFDFKVEDYMINEHGANDEPPNWE